MTADPEQPAVEPATGKSTPDSHRLAALKAGARRLLEVQRSRIRIVEATLNEQAATLLEIASRQEAVAAEQQQQLAAEREQLAQGATESRDAQQQAERLLEEVRSQLADEQARSQEAQQAAEKLLSDLRQELSQERSQAEESQQQDRQELVAENEQLAAKHAQAQQAQEAAELLLSEARDALAAAVERQAELRGQLAESKQHLEEQAGEFAALKERASAGSCDEGELESLMEENERLREERTAIQQQLSAAMESSTTTKGASEEAAILRERLESAVEELRQLKIKNDELSQQNKKLSASSSDGSGSTAVASGAFDWESQKQALMRQMEADFDDSDPEQKSNRLTVEGAIRITDEVVADKDREIQELKELLTNQSGSIGDVAVGAAAIAEMLDQDELVRDERENLRRMQEEWKEKLRKAEVEISVERAKFARERIELDEQIRNFERQQESAQPSDGSPADSKSPRGNWLSRLGLKDEN